MSKEDPKHGRWILPLVVLALVAFTLTFVNNLPPAETPVATTLAAGQQTTTTETPNTTTTTALTPEVVAFVATVDSLSAEAADMQSTAERINNEYPDTVGYDVTRGALSEFRIDTGTFVESVETTANVPTPAEEKWSDVTTAAAAMELAAETMFDGLVNTSGSERRLGALEDYKVATTTLTQALADAKELAIEPPADSE